jgi:hypothetical protein
MTPFQALYGRPPPTIPQYHEGFCPVHEVDKNLASRDALLQQLKSNLHAANNRMKQQANAKSRDVEFQVGDRVFLKLHPYHQQSVFKRAYQKLASRFYGLYLVEEKIGNVAYKLQLSPSSRIHPVFHVSLLKKTVGDHITTHTDLPPAADDGELLLEPKCVLDTRWVKRGSKFIEESLIQWKQLPRDDATWENTQELRDKFMNFNLEDKVCVTGGSIDEPRSEPRRSARVAVKNPKYFD